MFILVNYSNNYGLNQCGTFTTHKKAYEHIAYEVAGYLDFDLMNLYPFDNQHDSLVYSEDDGEISAGYEISATYERCNLYDKYGLDEEWLIIEA